MVKKRIIELCQMSYNQGWEDNKDVPNRFVETEKRIFWREFLEIIEEEIAEDKREENNE